MVKMRKLLPIFLLSFSVLQLNGQQSNKIIFDEMANQSILYGLGTVDVFQNEQFSQWYSTEYEQYNVNTQVLTSAKPELKSITIKVVLATWCKDSKREVPRFIKILNALEFPSEKLEIIGVDRKKVCPEAGVEAGFVAFVPTFFFFRNGIEIGRIVEHPNESLESDLIKILQNK